MSVLTGLLDWLTAEAGTQVRRTANAHALLMVTATVLAITTVVVSLAGYATGAASRLVVVLSIVVALVVAAGGHRRRSARVRLRLPGRQLLPTWRAPLMTTTGVS